MGFRLSLGKVNLNGMTLILRQNSLTRAIDPGFIVARQPQLVAGRKGKRVLVQLACRDGISTG